MSWLDQVFPGTSSKRTMIDRSQALPGRTTPVAVPASHVVLGHPLRGEDPESSAGIGRFPGYQAVVLAGGCFWGVEEIFWQVPGVYTTAVGYAGGYTPNPSYEEVCTARTGHTESTLVVFDPGVVDLEGILRVFWESHDPTQEMRQGNDVGTQYRSAVFTVTDADADLVRQSARRFAQVVADAGLGPITTEIAPLAEAGGERSDGKCRDGRFYYAEDYHQQYLAKNPNGYRCHASTGLKYPA
ncbi:peptide-methionine (S)-S-oxide reductase MsrA [Gordonia pseudamarae]|jgi:peptide-methionine (S)-S-oxide reductase|uniref:Peptide methionine sulfoxide reductase MsrA n=1 Tax=Gordonia pseudamarae TaxID=2831662 RepID=A0ABX6IML9_9ACTN|nr:MULTISPECIES: peptide-methionine (S)-S-oxide reductase MsrA [Gordonia]MBD0024283.1 peptide-methionine (S)-S-oxide reductase MsrA [Gordonia sp. (in: high G+C Gram-positive bacteria)]QHN28304.1 peptide-methionine (S)-S-oxide reductase MsrA [Gordonia pseudamarae]QHN37173.1 peptide-methionine (S)-S-oxide reductase MsrA [Gordonia pseudamarae]